MSQTKFDEEMALNRQAYEEMKEQLRRDYAGQYVAIAFGRVIAASPDFDEALATVKQLEPPPEHCVVFPAEEDPMFDVVHNPYTEYLE